MSHAETCPICKGQGTINDQTMYTASNPRTCHGCNGCGWVTVQ